MDLAKVQGLVLSSKVDDWQRWEEVGWPSEGRHGDRATYRSDVALELHWGRVLNEHFVEPWTAHFANPTAHSFVVEATYGGSLVLQQVLVSVDGGRYTLPLPRVYLPDPNSSETEYRVEHRPLIMARLVQGLGGWGGYDTDQGCRDAGFILDS